MAQTKVNKRVAKIFTGLHGRVYKLSKGKIGGSSGDATIAVLTTTGRKSGKTRTTPLLAGSHPDGWVVIASYSGHDEHPGWYHNIKSTPNCSLQVGDTHHRVTAREATGDERITLWNEMASAYPDYAEYEAVTDREIPVIVLERITVGTGSRSL